MKNNLKCNTKEEGRKKKHIVKGQAEETPLILKTYKK